MITMIAFLIKNYSTKIKGLRYCTFVLRDGHVYTDVCVSNKVSLQTKAKIVFDFENAVSTRITAVKYADKRVGTR